MATDKTQTTPMRPNFFVLLGLNPNTSWDQALFEQVLLEKRRAWSVQQNKLGKIALDAKKNLAYIGEIRAVMADENQRRAEAAAALLLIVTDREAKESEFKQQLAFINAKDSIEQTELDKFINDFQDIYSAEYIKNQVSIQIASPNSGGSNSDQFLDPSIAKNIANLLSVVNKSSLYDLLNLSDATATQEFHRAAEDLYRDVVKQLTKTAEVTALTELAGLAQTVFQSEDMRKRYDETQRRASLDFLLADLDIVMNRVTIKEMQGGQVNLFLEKAQKAGWKRDDAYNRLREHARQRKWALAPTEVEARIRCRNCSRLNARDRTLCAECGQSLYELCPDCGEKVPAEDRICNNCGFPVGNCYMVDSHLAELEKFFNAGDSEQAQAILRILESAWKPKKADARLTCINEYKDKLAQREQQQMQTQREKESQLHTLINDKKLFEARRHLSTYGAEIQNREELQRSIDDSITQAQSLVNSIRNVHNMPPDEQISRIRKVEDICRDFPRINDLKVPPSPPDNLQAKVRGTTISLSWSPSTTQNVFYTIVRKSYLPPNKITDGKEVSSNVTGCTYEDATPLIGVPLYYAVFSGYDTLRSAQAALLTQPVLMTQGVLSVAMRVDDQLVDMNWETPPNVHSVVVVRKEQTPPASMSDGVRVGDYRPTQTRLTDRNVKNGQTYYYALYCQFKDHEGQLVPSPCEFISATPDLPPEPVHHLDIKSTRVDQGYEITISWQRPNKGDVIIMKTDKPFTLPAGKAIPQADLINYGKKLDQHPDSIIEKWANVGIAYYTPVIIFQEIAYVGTSQRFVCVDNISNLRHQNIGTAIRLHWRWPENCQEVLITYSMEGWPREDDPNAITRRVNFAEYDRMGYYDLRGTVDQDYYLVIVAVVIQNGTRITSEGIRVHTRQANMLEFTYEIRNPTMLRRKRTLHISARTPGTLPAMVLVGRRDRLPFKKTDGDLLQHIPSTLIGDREIVIELSERTYPPRTFGKLFLENDDMHATVVIRQPDEIKLRLS